GRGAGGSEPFGGGGGAGPGPRRGGAPPMQPAELAEDVRAAARALRAWRAVAGRDHPAAGRGEVVAKAAREVGGGEVRGRSALAGERLEVAARRAAAEDVLVRVVLERDDDDVVPGRCPPPVPTRPCRRRDARLPRDRTDRRRDDRENACPRKQHSGTPHTETSGSIAARVPTLGGGRSARPMRSADPYTRLTRTSQSSRSG